MAAVRNEMIPKGVETIVQALRTLIVDADDLPSERELSRELDVKRHQLRKALDYLRRTGEIDSPSVKRQTGWKSKFSERLVSISSPIEVIEMRLILEPSLARLASLRASPRDIERISEAAITPAGADASAVDREFHDAVAAAARNDLGFEIFQTVRSVGFDARLKLDPPKNICPNSRVRQRDAEHQAIADAIKQRDPSAAEAAMMEHLQEVSRRIQERGNASGSNVA